MKVVILTCDQPNQAALYHKLAAIADVAAVVLSRNIPRKPPRRSLRILLNRVQGRLFGRPFVRAWAAIQDRYRSTYGRPPEDKIVPVANVNDEGTIRAIDQHRPNLVVVSGTNLVGRKVIEVASAHGGIVNLHTGISPYIKGGPNCTNWCLAEQAFHLIGNTVMWLDPGIDTGPLIATERTPLDGREGLAELHWKVMEHAHDLYTRAVEAVGAGEPVARVPQSEIGPGKTYYTADWGGAAMIRAYANFRLFYSPRLFSSPRFSELSASVRLVSLPARHTGERPTGE
jgi:methionyl-tRNA formyltransferase